MMTDSRYKYYKANEDRIILKDGILFGKYFGETGSVKYYQSLIPKQLVNEVLCSWHGDLENTPEFPKQKLLTGKNIFFSKNGAFIREWVMSCEQCNREPRIDRSLTCFPLKNPNEHITALEEAWQNDLVPELAPTGGYEKIVTAMDVFSCYLYAYPT